MLVGFSTGERWRPLSAGHDAYRLVNRSRVPHTEKVIALSLDTWVSLATLAAGLAGMYAALRRELRTDIGGLRTEMRSGFVDLRSEISSVRTELRQDMTELRTELKQDMTELRTELKADIGRLDDRVYGLAASMRPPWEQKRAD